MTPWRADLLSFVERRGSIVGTFQREPDVFR
jgi:hypothetical protein